MFVERIPSCSWIKQRNCHSCLLCIINSTVPFAIFHSFFMSSFSSLLSFFFLFRVPFTHFSPLSPFHILLAACSMHYFVCDGEHHRWLASYDRVHTYYKPPQITNTSKNNCNNNNESQTPSRIFLRKLLEMNINRMIIMCWHLDCMILHYKAIFIVQLFFFSF